MPGPVIYVAVAISAVAAVIVFKEFVFDPHFRPRFNAWRDTRQRRRARPHVHSVSPSSPSLSEGDNGSRLSGIKDKKNQFKRSVESSDTHIDLRHLISSESLKSTVEADGDHTGIRLRRVGGSRKVRDCPVENTAHISGPNSTRPLIVLDGSNIVDEISTLGPKNRLSEGVSPVQAVQSDAPSTCGRGSPDSQIPVLIDIPCIPEPLSVTTPADLLTPTPMASGDPGMSFPTTDLLTPSDVVSGDQYLTPDDQTLPSSHRTHDTISPVLSPSLSIEFLSSPSFSPPGSPFVDAGMYHDLAESLRGTAAQRSEIPSGAGSSSPGVVDRTRPGAALFPAVRGDSDIFSLPSRVSSDMSSDEGDYDSVSILESEMSNWMSDAADGEGTALL